MSRGLWSNWPGVHSSKETLSHLVCKAVRNTQKLSFDFCLHTHLHLPPPPQTWTRGWRDGSGVKMASCSSRGCGFNSQHPHSGSQPSGIPVPGDPNLQPHMVHKHICKLNTHIHLKKNTNKHTERYTHERKQIL